MIEKEGLRKIMITVKIRNYFLVLFIIFYINCRLGIMRRNRKHQESRKTEILLSHRKYRGMIGKRIELAR